jgi:hypothetical protein
MECVFSRFISPISVLYCLQIFVSHSPFRKKDFEAITPNILARTIETVEGGGLIILLLKTMTSLKQLYTLAMVHSL